MESEMNARIEAGWLIAPVKRWSGFGTDREVVTVEACAWIGSATMGDALPAIRRIVKPVAANLNLAEASGAMTDLSAGTLKSSKGDATDAADKACKVFFRNAVKGGSASDAGIMTPAPARGEAAGGPAKPMVPAPTTTIERATEAAPAFVDGTPEARLIMALVRIDLGTPKAIEERLIKGVWKVAPIELIAALDFMGVESRKVSRVDWRVNIVHEGGSVEIGRGSTVGEFAERAAYNEALLAVGADPLPADPVDPVVPPADPVVPPKIVTIKAGKAVK